MFILALFIKAKTGTNEMSNNKETGTFWYTHWVKWFIITKNDLYEHCNSYMKIFFIKFYEILYKNFNTIIIGKQKQWMDKDYKREKLKIVL